MFRTNCYRSKKLVKLTEEEENIFWDAEMVDCLNKFEQERLIKKQNNEKKRKSNTNSDDSDKEDLDDIQIKKRQKIDPNINEISENIMPEINKEDSNSSFLASCDSSDGASSDGSDCNSQIDELDESSPSKLTLSMSLNFLKLLDENEDNNNANINFSSQ